VMSGLSGANDICVGGVSEDSRSKNVTTEDSPYSCIARGIPPRSVQVTSEQRNARASSLEVSVVVNRF
jgi:hypothetical protein